MGHGPAVKLGKDNASAYKTRLGVKMFIAYTLVYAIFVATNATNPKSMQEIYLGQTAAVLWGFGLIGLALVMAIIYNGLCTKAEIKMNS
jgi:phosphotransferase system  glucose/maltose/N-acetylglucosamine-specific IIC component